MILMNVEQGSEEWLQARSGVITSSRFCDARGRLSKASKNGQAGDPNGDAIKYAWTIAMERIAGKPLDDTFATWQMRRGTELEPMARMAYEVRTGLLASESGIILTDDRKFGYSSDGFVDDDGMIEVKCPASCEKLGMIWSIPENAALEYIDQINGGMWISGRKWCDLVIFCPWLDPVGKALFIKRIHRDDDQINLLENDLMNFSMMVDRYENILKKENNGQRFEPM